VLATDLLTLLGFYSYDHGPRWENWISGPYELIMPPTKPIVEAELPPEMRLYPPVVLGANDFASDERVQPVDTLPCLSWQSTYVESDERTIKPIPPHKTLDYCEETRKSLMEKGFILEEPPDLEPWKKFRRPQW
jgi:hypothetical protein